ncbi:hypothetical protein NP493_2543g00001 [Ridgeia piscesae]|uniref:Uncharacterized protein n=1 Tax=Ridgeia piscesae TaxID=27915 RepID=A0AAD9N095_RIDPI|nr:hypothetical protein NP493_2543g00001 [Ridgeia piscesae]
MQSFGVPKSMCLWILDFILNRPQVVKIGDKLSSSVTYLLARLRAVFCHQCYILFLHMIVYLVTYVLKY